MDLKGCPASIACSCQPSLRKRELQEIKKKDAIIKSLFEGGCDVEGGKGAGTRGSKHGDEVTSFETSNTCAPGACSSWALRGTCERAHSAEDVKERTEAGEREVVLHMDEESDDEIDPDVEILPTKFHDCMALDEVRL